MIHALDLLAPFVVSLALGVAQAPPPPAGDPTKAEVGLGSRAGWDASLVHRGDAGIWNVKAVDLLPRYGAPEVIASDDKGRCTVLVSYSGKWTPLTAVVDGEWLGPVALGDLDPSIEGEELYTGGKGGRLWQIRPLARAGFDVKLVAEFPGEEIHTLVLGDLDAARAGVEMLVFLASGPVHAATGGPGGLSIGEREISRSRGRVRDAIALPATAGGESPWIVTASRDGEVALVRLAAGGKSLERRAIVREPMGFGRLALLSPRAGEPFVLYASRDDGVILRLESASLAAGAEWKREMIYAGPQGPRGLAAGRFDPDPEVETVAVFGYSRRVELLSRKKGSSGPWRVETIFEDLEAGHWLETAELDGRNATDELLGSGYASRVFLLARPPGTGLPGVPADSPPARKGAAAPSSESRPARIAASASRPTMERLTPLSYRGGFVTKTPIYETLVRRDAEGRIVPLLASSFLVEDGGRAVIFRLREGARFHDGSPVDAAAVALHFRRWVGLPEHAWIGASERIRSVTALSPSEVRIEMDVPYALLPDLCAINPCSIQGPGAIDREGSFARPVGTGPYRFGEEFADEATNRTVFRYVAHDAGDAAPSATSAPASSMVDLVLFEVAAESVDALLAGEVDAVADSWTEMIPRDRVAELEADGRFDVTTSPGSSVRYLSFRMDEGPTASAAIRRRIAAAVDRDALVRTVEGGVADPCATWAAPAVLDWPKSAAPAPSRSNASVSVPPLRIVALASVTREADLARAVAAQLERAGLEATVDVLETDAFRDAITQGRFDIRFERTWGVPYDPDLSLRARFLPPEKQATAAEDRFFGVDPRATAIVRRLESVTADADRRALHAEMQSLIDAEAVVVPLFVPRRVAAIAKGRGGPLSLGPDLYRMEEVLHALRGDARAEAIATR